MKLKKKKKRLGEMLFSTACSPQFLPSAPFTGSKDTSRFRTAKYQIGQHLGKIAAADPDLLPLRGKQFS